MTHDNGAAAALERLEELVEGGRWRAVQTAGLRVAGRLYDAAEVGTDDFARADRLLSELACTCGEHPLGELVERGLIEGGELVEMVAGIAEREELVAA